MPPVPYATLFDVVLRLAREVLLVRDGTATSGTTTSLTDTNIQLPLDTFREGSIFLPATSIFRVITQQDKDTFTWSTAATAPVAGAAYAVVDKDVPLDVLISAVNSAIRKLVLPAEDITVLTVASQEEYALPANVSGIFKVEVAASATSPYGYSLNQHWDEVNGYLRFAKGSRPGTTGNIIRLTYRRPHTDILVSTTALPNDINLDYLHWTAVLNVAKYGQRVHSQDPKRDWPAKAQEAEVRAQRYASAQVRLQKTPRLADW
jgi:hypothetical protein